MLVGPPIEAGFEIEGDGRSTGGDEGQVFPKQLLAEGQEFEAPGTAVGPETGSPEYLLGPVLSHSSDEAKFNEL